MATGTRLVKGARAWSTQSFCGLELERSDVADRAGGAVAVLRSGHPTLVGGGRRTIRAADIDCRAAGQQGVGLGGAAVVRQHGSDDGLPPLRMPPVNAVLAQLEYLLGQACELRMSWNK